MKVKDVDDNINVQLIKFKLTPELKESYADYSSKGEEEMFMVGPTMGDWFISPLPPTVGEREIYPMPLGVKPSNFLECDVVEILDEDENKKEG